MYHCASPLIFESCWCRSFGNSSAFVLGRLCQEESVKHRVALTALMVVAGISAQAKGPIYYQNGRLTQMTSVSCGYTENSGKSFIGEIVGTDGGHMKNKELLCQEYVLKTDKVMYHIRPKEEKHPTLLPIGEDAKFRIKKDRLLLTIPEIGAKEAEYFVVSMTQVQPDATHTDNSKMEVPLGAK
jgi:hypothetical protein